MATFSIIIRRLRNSHTNRSEISVHGHDIRLMLGFRVSCFPISFSVLLRYGMCRFRLRRYTPIFYRIRCQRMIDRIKVNIFEEKTF